MGSELCELESLGVVQLGWFVSSTTNHLTRAAECTVIALLARLIGDLLPTAACARHRALDDVFGVGSKPVVAVVDVERFEERSLFATGG